MALLGTFIHNATGATFAANSGIAGPIYQTVQHSLGAVPSIVLANPTSIGVGTLPPPHLFVAGANASIATIGLAASTLGNSVIAFDVICWNVHSSIR